MSEEKQRQGGKPEKPPVLSTEAKGHSAYAVWRIFNDRAIAKVAPSLAKKSNSQALFTFLLIIVASIGAVGAGIYIDGYGIHPPAQYTGHCPPPDTIVHNGFDCVLTTTTNVTVSGAVTQIKTVIAAGQIIYSTTTTTSTNITSTLTP